MKSEGDRIGPGHPAFLREKESTRMFFHYYDQQRAGFASIGDQPIHWADDGWPKL